MLAEASDLLDLKVSVLLACRHPKALFCLLTSLVLLLPVALFLLFSLPSFSS